MPSRKDAAIVRELAARAAEIAALPVQEEKRALWRRLNALKPARPMVMIDQVCWNEMNVGDELTLALRRRGVPRVRGTPPADAFPMEAFSRGHGRSSPSSASPRRSATAASASRSEEHTAVTDPTSDVVGHKYDNQFRTEADLEKVRTPRISHDAGRDRPPHGRGP